MMYERTVHIPVDVLSDLMERLLTAVGVPADAANHLGRGPSGG